MKNVFACIAALLLILPYGNSQTNTNLQSSYHTESIILGKDTLIKVTMTKSIRAEFYESEIQATFLLQEKENRIDTLLAATPIIEDFELHPDFVNIQKFDLSEVISEIKYGKYEPYEMDSTRYQYWGHTRVNLIQDGIFRISYSNSSYTGGPHGYGQEYYTYYDYYTHKKFEFEDVFEPEVWNLIHRVFIKEMKIDKSETDMEDIPSFYIFTPDSIQFECGMYGTIFGYGGNYLGCHFSVPYSKLKRYMIKDSPIWRLIN